MRTGGSFLQTPFDACRPNLAPGASVLLNKRPRRIVKPRPPVTFEGSHLIAPNTVLYINNRPGEIPYQFHTDMRTAYRAMVRQTGNDDITQYLPKDTEKQRQVIAMIKRGLKDERFKDTRLISEWLHIINHEFVGFNLLNMPEMSLQLMVVSAEQYIDDLHDLLVRQNMRPAGVILSGSPKMLSKAAHNDDTVKKTLDICDHLLEAHIPVLGICFGMQMLAYVGYGAMCQYLETPPGMHYRIARKDPFLLEPVTPGVEQMIFGSWMVRWTGEYDPILRQTGSEVMALELHSQYLPYQHPNIPDDAVLAISSRSFLPDKPVGELDQNQVHIERMIEVLRFGGQQLAYGTQLHPELTPELLMAFTYHPVTRKYLIEQKMDVALRQEFLNSFPPTYHFTAEKYGFNWAKYVMFINYIEEVLMSHPLTRGQRADLTELLQLLYDKRKQG